MATMIRSTFIWVILLTVLSFSSALAQNVTIQKSTQIAFDPERDPVVIRQDNSLLLSASPYLIAKSVKARMGSDYHIQQVFHFAQFNYHYLVVQGYSGSNADTFFQMSIPLIFSENGNALYASSGAITCQSTTCNNCGGVPPNCAGCCSSTSGQMINSPLTKVFTTNE